MEHPTDREENSCTIGESGAVQLTGEHDVASAPEFETALQAGAKLSAGPLAVDLTRATFIDSSIAAALVRCARELVRDEREVVLRVTADSSPALVIEIVGLASQAGIVVETVPASDG